ncbi:pyrroline-5-carboxylate reductase protein [Rutstroemia sp. NJR-2017a WRK4]|nr:pyrroline-5-carboxylate reductase protein [Rutstroemia sp. NJR-2017a WRK4]
MSGQATNGHEPMTLAVIGCGSMGSAILAGILKSSAKEEKAPISHFIACVQSQESVKRLNSSFSDYSDRLTILRDDNLTAINEADVILLACKPYMAESILGCDGIADALANKLVISVLAGTPEERLRGFVYKNSSPGENSCSFVRAMPNLAAQIGESITLISSGTTPISEKFTEISGWIFKQIGETSYLADNLFQAGGVLAGATPAWFTLALDGILDGAVSEGIKRGVAMEILAQSMLGTAKMIQSGEHPAILREKISSPKGTTIQGLNTLEKGGVRSSFTDAFINATQHGLNMK